MTEQDQERSFIEPEIVELESDESSQEGGGIVPASQVLPERIYILPNGSKPVYPGLVFPLIVGSPQSRTAELVRAVTGEDGNRLVGVVLTRHETTWQEMEQGEDEMDHTQLYRIGTVARILKVEQTEEGYVQVLLQGEKRFEIKRAWNRNRLIVADVEYQEDEVNESEELRASAMGIIKSMRELMNHNPVYSEEIRMFLSRADWREPGRLADFAATMTSAEREDLQEVLECIDVQKRVEKVLFLLRKELDLNELKEKITKQIEEKISKQQREFFLREQLKAIKQELGIEKDEKTEEVEKYRNILSKLEVSDEVHKAIEEQIQKLELLSPQSPEFSVVRTYLDWLTGLPWKTFSKDRLDVKRARRQLNRDHYGLEDIKKRILEFIGVAKMKGGVEGSILCFIGPPGVGKTSLGKSIAEALGRKFYRFSLGGMHDEAEIKGHRRTYIGAMPGKVMQAINNVQTANPVIMLDEIDKLAASFQGDPASALLEVLDPEQNVGFRDHYLDVPFDLSKVLFIATANVPDTIPGVLFDRMEPIRLSGYIPEEKFAIAKRHLIPRLVEEHGLTKSNVRFTDGALRAIANGYAREAGVRTMEKSLATCLRKIAAQEAEGKENGQTVVTKSRVEEFLGKPRFEDDPLLKKLVPGVALGVAWTQYGGETMYVETVTRPGKEELKITGQLGEVMSESSHIAFSLVKAQAETWGIDKSVFEDRSIHVHVPAGATPKDGPSAGVTLASALISLARNESLPEKVAMTGELTLSGRVLPVGGIKEKIIAAKRANVHTVILPKDNEKDFNEIPEKVREGVNIQYVSEYEEIFRLLFQAGVKRKGRGKKSSAKK